MLLDLTADQEFFRGTTAKFLDAFAPADELRRRRHDAAGFDRDYWRRGAELGWTTLLAAEEHGGGTISGRGVVDLTLIAYEFGHAAAPGPLVATNVVASALSDAGAYLDVVADIVAGASIATWAGTEPGARGRSHASVEIRLDGDEVVLDGVAQPVESAGEADHLLVTGRTGDGLSQVLVPRDAAGVAVEPMHTVDLTRRFATVRFDGVRVPARALLGEPGGAAPAVARQDQLALVMLAAESVGAMQAAFDMTVEWAFDRYSFGRPLASYQELKHRFADMKSWLEASHAIADAAAVAVQDRTAGAAELASVAKAYIGQYGVELVQDCVQIHGGIGVTFEHDLHLFLRRVILDAALLGTASEHRQRIAEMMERGAPRPGGTQ
jgi:alkylation response protein AidB-like acyl-CoA dehydrogenase